jgi:1,4-dihydroxy-2-naphthoyl-CoA hydrolase
VEDLDAFIREGTLDDVLGFELLELGEETARARVPYSERVTQHLGLVHGGVYAALAEKVASAATFRAVAPDGMVALGLSNDTSFLRPVTEGEVRAEATRLHRGRTTWVWDVRLLDGEGRLCALSRVTVAVRPGSGTPG